jgi:GC-rich sequence DNA-binding factor
MKFSLSAKIMFRSKKKKNVNGGRKRVIQEEQEENQITEEKTLKEEDQVTDDVEMGMNEQNEVEEVEEIDHGDMLERARQRMKIAKTKKSFAMKFSSKSTIEKNEVVKANILSMNSGKMSFEKDDDHSNTMTTKIRKIRPNLMKENHIEQEKLQEENAQQNSYSVEMLESLRKEQKALLRPLVEQEQVPEEDIEMIGIEEDKGPQQQNVDESMNAEMEIEQEEKKEEDVVEEEEFIPLHSKMMKNRKRRNCVTFGIKETHMPDLSQPVEDIALSDLDDDEEQEHSRRWEEELMRRGGHATHPKQASFSRKSDDQITYPTKRSVPCAPLSEITMKLQKQLEQSAFENDRASRDLARLDSEATLLEQNLVKQREELLISSEQFEYFQEMEDYVKGLSFCLREKLVLIQQREKDILDQRSQAFKKLCDLEDKDTIDHVQTLVATGDLSLDHITADSKLLASIKDQSLNHTISQDDTERIVKFQGSPEDFSKAVVKALSMVRSDSEIDFFEDAVEEMNSLEHVYGKFQEWKHKFPQVYTEVYCDLALPKLYAPFVKAELLQWEPLLIDSSWTLQKMVFFRTLTQHLNVPEASEAISNVITSIFKDVVISRIEKSLVEYFDPFTRVYTSSFIILLKELKSCSLLCTTFLDKAFEKLIGTIADTFSQALGKLVLISTSNSDGTTSEFASYQVQKLLLLVEHLVLLVVSDVDISSVLFMSLAILKQFLMRCKQLQKTWTFSMISARIEQILNDSSIQSCSILSHKQQLIQWKQELAALI